MHTESTPATLSAPPSPSAPVRRGDPAVVLSGLRRHYGTGERRVTAVDGIDLTVQRGEVVALLGPNGAGKTTTLDMLLGLIEPSDGAIRVFGAAPARAAAAGVIAAVLQTGGLLADLTVRETVQVIASLHGRAALSRVPEVLARADLSGLAGRRVSKLSGGEQQRVKFALALAADPDILVLDEPTAGMDVTARRRFWEAMRADADAGRTIIFATHYLEEAEQFARRTVVLHRGRIVADAPTVRLRAGLGARRVSATVRVADRDEVVRVLTDMPGVADLRIDVDRLSLRAQDSDAVASALLALGATELEIVAPTLESAFTTLTED